MTDALRLQQRLLARGLDPGPLDGLPGAKTWAALFRYAGARQTRAEALGRGAALYWPDFGIQTGLRVAHFVGQAAHESGGFQYLEEIWGPTDAQRRYEGRRDLGNTQPGDGRRFAGRGIFQLTGRANYARLATLTGLPLLDQPLLAADPANSVWIACIYWQGRNLNRLADRDDGTAITRAINGGTNGLADRQARTARLKTLLL